MGNKWKEESVKFDDLYSDTSWESKVPYFGSMVRRALIAREETALAFAGERADAALQLIEKIENGIQAIDGVVRDPSALGMTIASPCSTTQTQEFVVPRSMPITCPIGRRPLRYRSFASGTPAPAAAPAPDL